MSGDRRHRRRRRRIVCGFSNTKTSPVPRMLAGVTTGSLAIMVAQPMDVVKIRMQVITD